MFPPAEIKVKLTPEIGLGEMAKPKERIFDSISEDFAPEQVVVNRDPQIKLPLHGPRVPVEIQIISPTRKKEFPLEVR